jgi:S-adenosylmethionine-diacylglycerol 3-amino-3-carboxypropyl transferase
MEEQRTLYQSVLEPLFREPLVRMAARLPVALFPLGIPPRQYQLMARGAMNGSITDDLISRVARLACHFPIDENPFAWQVFARRYDTSSRRAIPLYLKPDVYDAIRLRARNVELYNISLAEFLRRQREGAFDRFVLLDSQDWMSEEQLIQLWRELGRVSDPDGARIVFRTAARESPYIRLPRELRQQWVYDDVKSKQLYSRDRSAIYGGFHLYHRSRV